VDGLFSSFLLSVARKRCWRRLYYRRFPPPLVPISPFFGGLSLRRVGGESRARVFPLLYFCPTENHVLGGSNFCFLFLFVHRQIRTSRTKWQRVFQLILIPSDDNGGGFLPTFLSPVRACHGLFSLRYRKKDGQLDLFVSVFVGIGSWCQWPFPFSSPGSSLSRFSPFLVFVFGAVVGDDLDGFSSCR